MDQQCERGSAGVKPLSQARRHLARQTGCGRSLRERAGTSEFALSPDGGGQATQGNIDALTP